ncbi:MAG: hypothetical protein JWM80_1604, partial [Cyanobacteria bacterium RYN_339]|nr:hypothetical protein [Cyanobacteria bacterium RYN_339]
MRDIGRRLTLRLPGFQLKTVKSFLSQSSQGVEPVAAGSAEGAVLASVGGVAEAPGLALGAGCELGASEGTGDGAGEGARVGAGVASAERVTVYTFTPPAPTAANR